MFDNDIMATAALNTARKLDIDVPGQLSIIAGDDSQLCEMAYPTLSALTRDVQAYGANPPGYCSNSSAPEALRHFRTALPGSSSGTASPRPPPFADPGHQGKIDPGPSRVTSD